MTTSRTSDGRVRESHRQTRTTLRLSLAFLVVAAAAAASGQERWMPLHLVLAGGVGQAISGVTLMLTVTWSAAPAPAGWAVMAQRSLLVVGAVGVVAGRELELATAITAGAGVAYLVGLALLAYLLVSTVALGSERRFDVAVGGYVAALVLAVAAIGVGVYMVSDGARPELRAAHATLNLLGFVGLVILTTLPFFGSTVGRSRMSHRVTSARLGSVLGFQVVAVVVAAAGIVLERTMILFVALGAYGYGILMLLAFMPVVTRRQFDWAGPRILALWIGPLWMSTAVLATAYEAERYDRLPFTGNWLLVLVVGGFIQIVWGALAYLLPMLRGGGHQKLSEGFAATRSWLGLGAVNVAALGLVFEIHEVAAVALALLLADSAWRTARVGLKRLERPRDPHLLDQAVKS
ncbi:MAG: hypothetical protein IPG97_07810 [Microthrixaceae bacterium]|jgi:nitrite reductase (NO-forming)|nr:hypothetical protein [Microthrixaceae bacterium]